MTDPLLVARKLAAIREHVARARRRRPADATTLTRDVDLHDALAMAVLVAIQEAIDLAFHIAADERWGVPASYAEGFALLQRNSVIDAELAKQMTQAAGLRNRLAHGYASLDPDRFWVELPAGLDVMEAYVSAVARFMERERG